MTAVAKRPPQDAHRSPNPPALPLPPPPVMRRHLAAVLRDLRFPAQRWQVIAEADAWGVTCSMRRFIGLLPDGTYKSLREVLDQLCAPWGDGHP